MISVEKIYFDMDGVLADFDRGVFELCGVEPPSQPGGRRSKENDDLMWERMKGINHFYAQLYPMPGAVLMFNKIYDVFGDRCEILTGIPKPHREINTASEDKINWISTILPNAEGLKVHTVFRAEKVQFCKGSGYILIDDYESNIDEWVSCGGTGILHRDVEDTLRKLSSITGIKLQ